jgi:gas vesicle protein
MKTSLIFLLGLGMGTVLGILIAPEAGKITRRKIREEADRIIDQALAKKQLKELEAEMPDEVVVVEEERYTI